MFSFTQTIDDNFGFHNEDADENARLASGQSNLFDQSEVDQFTRMNFHLRDTR